MTYFNNTSFGFNNAFSCCVENGEIFQIDAYNNKVSVGQTNELVKEKEDILNEYYNKLVELGAIVPPKTQEEINSELQQALKESQTLNFEMLQLLKELKGEKENEQSNDNENKTNVSKRKSGRSDKNSDTSGGGEITE